MAHSIIGLTIEMNELKLARIKTVRGDLVLDRCHTLRWGSLEHEQTGQPGMIESLTTLVKEDFFVGSDLMVALPSARVTTKTLVFPFSDRRKIESVLADSLEEHLAYAIDQAHIITTPIVQDKDQSKVLAWAVRKNEISELIALLGQIGLEPRGIYPEAVALSTFAGLVREDEQANRLILALYRNHAVIVVRSGPTIVQQRVITIGLDQILNAAQAHDHPEGLPLETILTGPVSDPSPLGPDQQKQLERAFVDLKTELIRTIQSLKGQTDLNTVRQIEVTGDLNCSQPVWAALNKDFAFEFVPLTHYHPSIRNRNQSPDCPVNEQNIQAYSTALGLCLHGLDRFSSKVGNLRSGEFIYRKDIALLKGKLIVTAILLGLVLVLGFSSLFYHVNLWENVYEQKKNEISTIFQTAFPNLAHISGENQLPLVKQKLNELTSELQSFGKHEQGRPSHLSILLTLSQIIPPTIKLDIIELSISDTKLEMKGEIDTYKSVDLVRNEIQKLAYVSQVTTGKTTKDVREEVLIFQMTALFKNPGGVQ
ncbi:hypothetical protein JXQ70_13065 [bacterium]|nr:hypothetical protein [bacterium]